MKFLKQLTVIILVCFAGEVVKGFIPLPVPGNIYGLVIMFVRLCTGLIKLDMVEQAADFLIEAMPLMFIPGGVAIMFSWDILKSMLPAVAGAILLVTPFVMVVTGKVAQAMIDRRAKR